MHHDSTKVQLPQQTDTGTHSEALWIPYRQVDSRPSRHQWPALFRQEDSTPRTIMARRIF